MPTTNQLLLGAQQRLPKKRMRDKKTPALQGVLKNVEFVYVFIPKHLKNQTQLLEKLRRLD